MTRDETTYRLLVRLGMMPQDAEEVIRWAAAHGQQLPSDEEIAQDAQVTAADVEQAKQWWLFNDDVPLKYKRLLSARER